MKIIVIDFSQVVVSNVMVELAGKKDVEFSIPILRHMILNSIRAYNKKHRAEYGSMVIACDSSSYWRKEVFPQYKANRKKVREESGIDWDTLFKTMDMVKQELRDYFPYSVVNVNGAEADDVIATLAEWSQTNDTLVGLFHEQAQPFLIISGDKDFVQLQKYPNVKQFSPVLKKWIKAEQPVEYILLEHIFRGDTGDGIPNVLSADSTFVEGKRQTPLMSKKLDAWIKDESARPQTDEFKRNFDRNRTLIDLSKIPQQIKDAIVNDYTSQPVKDRSKLLNYFMAHKMKQLMDVLQDF